MFFIKHILKLNQTTRRCLSSCSFTKRSHTCGQLRQTDVGQKVNLYGWVERTRFNNKFIVLRDSYGVTQCVLNPQDIPEAFKKCDIPLESVLRVSGIVAKRLDGQKNDKQSTGEIEVKVEEFEVVNNAKCPLPISPQDSSRSKMNKRLKYRYLELRSKSLQHTLRFRSRLCKIIRDKLHDLNFVECETPTLFTRTPGGANEFIVPTRTSNEYYSLVQSPQQLKQLLMIGGLDRYFQISRCYRDENGRSDRQPEFTQVDIELSFTEQKLVMNLVDELIQHFSEKLACDTEFNLNDRFTSLRESSLRIDRMSYKEAFNSYGTDKPDLRFGWKIQSDGDGLYFEIPHFIEDEKVLKILDRNSIRSMNHSNKIESRLTFETDKALNKTILKSQTQTEVDRRTLGRARTEIANELIKLHLDVYKCDFKFLWVYDFPLFTVNEMGELESNHHPFTAPSEETIHLLRNNPREVIGQHYDLVLNGQEIAGGSIRIHDAELQRLIFSDLLKFDERKLAYFTEALAYGCPPHGGIAFGLERMIAIFLGKESIRDVMAFPKTLLGRDVMAECPHEVEDDVKQLYHIK